MSGRFRSGGGEDQAKFEDYMKSRHLSSQIDRSLEAQEEQLSDVKGVYCWKISMKSPRQQATSKKIYSSYYERQGSETERRGTETQTVVPVPADDSEDPEGEQALR